MTRRLLTFPLLAAAAAGAVLYAPVIAALGRQWVDDTTTSHGILVALAAAFVVHRRIPALRAIQAQPSTAGLALVALGLGFYILGTFGAEVFVLRLSLPLVALGSIAALWGRTHARLLLSAFGLLLLAIPLPSVVVTTLTMPRGPSAGSA